MAGFNPVIIAESTTALKRLSVSEAVTELDMTGAPVVVFRHAGHGRVNIVYRRADGHIGWIDPPAMQPSREPLTQSGALPMVPPLSRRRDALPIHLERFKCRSPISSRRTR